MAQRFLEDFPVGSTAEFGHIQVTADEIIEFARRYDPQPFHVNEERARQWPFGGLIASGWHTAAMTMRALVEEFIDAESSLGSPGLGPIHWKVPVRPGDVLRARARVLENRLSRSKSDRGTLVFEIETLNQKGESVMLIENWIAIVRARPVTADRKA